MGKQKGPSLSLAEQIAALTGAAAPAAPAFVQEDYRSLGNQPAEPSARHGAKWNPPPAAPIKRASQNQSWEAEHALAQARVARSARIGCAESLNVHPAASRLVAEVNRLAPAAAGVVAIAANRLAYEAWAVDGAAHVDLTPLEKFFHPEAEAVRDAVWAAFLAQPSVAAVIAAVAPAQQAEAAAREANEANVWRGAWGWAE